MKHEFENISKLGKGIYSTEDISLILGISKGKIRTWINKYWDGKLGNLYNRQFSWKVENYKAIDFHTLVEFYVLSNLMDAGVSTKEILKAHIEISEITKTSHPFANQDVFKGMMTDGKKLYLQYKGDELVSLDGKKQFNLEIIKNYFKNLEFGEDNMVSKIWPSGKSSSIVCDPDHKFGLPVVNKTNIQAEAIYRMFLAGDNVSFISSVYEIPEKNVNDAITLFKLAA